MQTSSFRGASPRRSSGGGFNGSRGGSSFGASAQRGGFGRGGQRSGGFGRGGPRPSGAYGGGGFSRGGNRGGGRRRPSQLSDHDISRFINKNVQEVAEEVYTPVHTFADFGLAPELKRAVDSCGFTAPTPIQDQVITSIIEGKDVVGLANTGTGKTGAFLIPLIERTLANRRHMTVILAPTRELALQIDKELHRLTRGLNIYSATLVGGMPIGGQLRMLRMFNHFIIGTPGRVQDLIDRRALWLGEVNAVVLDEADRMLDMGFIDPIRKILSETPDTRQTLFFSATMSREIEGLIHTFLRDHVTVSVKKRDTANSIEQDVVHFGGRDKLEVLVELLRSEDFKRTLVFGETKHGVEKLAMALSQYGIKAASIHGNKSHGQRQRALTDFKNGHAEVLVATDVAARGIHVDKVSHVVNYDMPNTHDDYVHRIGRTGRGEHKGKALTFVR